jgi:hypothetical protein
VFNSYVASLPPVAVDYEIVVKVQANPGKGTNQQLQLLLRPSRVDIGSYAVQARYGEKGPEVRGVLNLIIGGGDGKVEVSLEKDVYLRLTRTKGNQWTSWYSYDGKSWTYVYEASPPPGATYEELWVQAIADPAQDWMVTLYSATFGPVTR